MAREIRRARDADTGPTPEYEALCESKGADAAELAEQRRLRELASCRTAQAPRARRRDRRQQGGRTVMPESLDEKRARQGAAREALAQAQRSNPDPAPSLDFDSRRRARETATAAERAKQQRARLAETRAVHAPLGHAQAQAAHRNWSDVNVIRGHRSKRKNPPRSARLALSARPPGRRRRALRWRVAPPVDATRRTRCGPPASLPP